MPRFVACARTVALAAGLALVLAGCNQTNEGSIRANKPLSPKMLSLIASKEMVPSSPILVRIYKEESELEVWKANTEGRFDLLKTYPICRWSGELGPKVRVGDRQAPEGFYTITPGQMNPNSSYYLSFNLGFPNAFDKSYGRTGEFLMVHGDCSSSGCYAMTDEQISEIFSLARESFAGGQRAFQVQAYPFRMTPKNLAKHRKNPNMPFWRNLKQGSDHFEVTRQEPKVNVCGRRYVFDAQAEAGRAFDPNQDCPVYQVPEPVAQAVAAKAKADDAQVAALSPSAPVAPVRTNRDGGMHPVFLAKFKKPQPGSNDLIAFAPELPGTVPDHTRPPRIDDETDLSDSGGPAKPAAPSAATTVALATAPSPAPAVPEASAPALALRTGTPDLPQAPVPPARPPVAAAAMAPPAPAAPKPAVRPSAAETATLRTGAPAQPAAAPAPAAKPAAAKPAQSASAQGSAQGSAQASAQASAFAPPPTASTLTGASPIVSVGTFSR